AQLAVQADRGPDRQVQRRGRGDRRRGGGHLRDRGRVGGGRRHRRHREGRRAGGGGPGGAGQRGPARQGGLGVAVRRGRVQLDQRVRARPWGRVRDGLG